VTRRIELVAEIYADLPLTDANRTAAAWDGGIRWSVSDQCVLDAAVGAGLHGVAPDWTATVGLTWTFDFNRQPSP
jgi:hypothetical protein